MEATMATKITVVLEDDLVGGPADETVRSGIGGTDYEINLNAKNASAFRQQLAPYIEQAPPDWQRTAAAAGADCGQPGTERGHPGLGERPGHRAQRPRPHSCQHRPAVPSRHGRTVTPA
jgi:hypothetical protein